MKKVVLLSILCFIAIMAKSNPIYVPPTIKISELYFDHTQSNKWYLELYYYERSYIDSFEICSSTGKSKTILLKYNGVYGEGYKLITSDSLLTNININPLGDSITLIVYRKEGYPQQFIIEKDILVFGNYRNATISKAVTGNSITRAYYGYIGNTFNPGFCKCKSPSLGLPNSSETTMGTIQGKIYDYQNNPLANIKFALQFTYLSDPQFTYYTSSVSGTYNISIQAKRHIIDSIFLLDYRTSESVEYDVLKTKFKFDLEPDSVITCDFYLSNVWVGTSEIKKGDDACFRIFPNPLNSESLINYETNLPVLAADCFIEIVDMQGKLLNSLKVKSTTGSFTLPTKISNGIFILNFKVNGKVYKSIRLIKNK